MIQKEQLNIYDFVILNQLCLHGLQDKKTIEEKRRFVYEFVK